MNFSDSKVGKKDQDWLIKTFLSSMAKHTDFTPWWNAQPLDKQKQVVDELRDTLRFRL
jgi:hypothetical protein